MKKNLYLLFVAFLSLLPLSMSAQQGLSILCNATRTVQNCKANSPNGLNDAIGWAMKDFFTDGSTATWRFEPGATFVEETNGTARLTGVIAHFANMTTRRFQVDIRFVNRSFSTPAGGWTNRQNVPTDSWYHYTWDSGTLIGLDHCAGARLNLVQHMGPLQLGFGGSEQVEDGLAFGSTGWFEWQIISQPSNGWLIINPYPANPAYDQADVCILLSGNPLYCPPNPCLNDNVPPVFTSCPSDRSAVTRSNCAVVTYPMPTATDQCCTPTVEQIAGFPSGSCFPIGTTINKFKATDENGNTSFCTFTVTVTGENPCDYDVTPPVFTSCPTNISVLTAANSNCFVVTYPMPTANDQCCTPTVVQTAGFPSGSCFPIGTTTNTFKATDLKGNTSFCTFTVKVDREINPCDVDNVPPVVICPPSKTAITRSHCAVVTFDDPIANDNCGVPTVTLTSAPTAGLRSGSCFPIGVTTLTATAVDLKGNSSNCQFTVTVTPEANPCDADVTPPTITCPSNKTITTYSNCATVTFPTPTGSDNCCTPTITQIAGFPSGSCFPVGTTTNTFKATDLKGNSSTCSFTVTVTSSNPCANDATPPTFLSCPRNITLTTTGNCAYATWATPLATDNCTLLPSITLATAPTANLNNGSCFPIGTTTVTYTATDAKGNSATCTFTVTVTKIVTCVKPVGNTITKACVSNLPVLRGADLPGFEYMWLSSTTGCPTASSQVVPNATGRDLALSALVSTTTYFVRCARPIGCTSWIVGSESNCVAITPADCAQNVVCSRPCTNITSSCTLLGLGSSCAKLWGRTPWIAGSDLVFKEFPNGTATLTGTIREGSLTYTVSLALSGKTTNCTPYITGCNTTNLTGLTYYTVATGTARCGNYVLTFKNTRPIQIGAGANLYHSGFGFGGWFTYTGNWFFGTYSATFALNLGTVVCAPNVSAAARPTVLEATATAEVTKTRIEWINNTEYKNDYFVLQRLNATTGEFDDLDIIDGKGVSEENKYYTAYDNRPTVGENHYRIKLTQNDGTTLYSDIQTVLFKASLDFAVFPNPSADIVNVDLKAYKGLDVTIFVYNQLGQQVFFQNIERVGDAPIFLDFHENNSGQYQIRVVAKDRKDVVKPFIIQH